MPDLLSTAPAPRICVIKKTYPGEEYGFNLHAEKGRGQYIGKIDPMSPAERGGLRENDRIVGVNGAILLSMPHSDVVARIKDDPNRAELMVIEEDGLEWYKVNGVQLEWDQANVVRVEDKTQPRKPSAPVVPEFSNGSLNDSSSKPKPRLCHLKKVLTTDEYGFNLHAEKGKGHFIGLVDNDSIGECAGLIRGQRIVGVNDTLIYPTTPHKEVVQLIRRDGMRTDLLVASPEVDEWYRNHGELFDFQYACDIVPNLPPSPDASSQPSSPYQMETQVSPAPASVTLTSGNGSVSSSKSSSTKRSAHKSTSSHGSHHSPHKEEAVFVPPPANQMPAPAMMVHVSDEPPPSVARQVSAEEERVRESLLRHEEPEEQVTTMHMHQTNGHHDYRDAAGDRKMSDERRSGGPASDVSQRINETVPLGGKRLDSSFLNMSLNEAKQRVASRRKHDPRDQPMSLEEKHRIVKNL